MEVNLGSITGYYTTFLAPKWGLAYDRTPAVYKTLTTEEPSSTLQNTYAWPDRLPKLREWIGERQEKNVSIFPMTVINRKFEETISVTRDQFEDDTYKLLSFLPIGLGEASAKYPDYILRDLLEAGETTLCYDGQDFFSTSHPVNPFNTALGNYTNLQTACALTVDNFAAQVAAMKQLNGADGEKLNVAPDTLIVGPDLEHEATRILFGKTLAEATMGAVTGVGGQDNVLAISAGRYGVKNLVVWNDLKLTGKWYLADNSKGVKPLIWQNRIAPQLTPMIDPSSEKVFYQDKFVWGVRARGNASFSLPFLMRKMAA